MTIDEITGQLAALEALKGTDIPVLNHGDKPIQLKDVLYGLKIQLLAHLNVPYTPRTAEITVLTNRIDALMAARYPPAAAVTEAALEQLKQRLSAEITPKPGADGR